MKRIIFTVSNDIRYDRRMQRICSSLSRRGYEVLLLGRALPDSETLPEFEFNCRRLKCWFSKGKLFYFELNVRLFFFLHTQDFDILSSVDLDTALPVLWVARRKNKPCVLDTHEYFPEVPEVERRPLIKWIWQKVEAFVVPKFNAVYTVSQSIAEIYSEQFNREVGLIRNMPTKSMLQPKPMSQRQKVILYQGALNEGRGLEALIKAMEGIEAILWMAGKGDIESELKSLTRQLGLEKKVKFLGWVLPEQLHSITEQCMVGVNLLEARSKSYYFSLANKTFDYVQAGLPAIHMNFPEYRALIEKYPVGCLIENLTPDTIQAAIQSVMEKDNWEVHFKACLRAREEWNWELEEEKLFEIYQKLD